MTINISLPEGQADLRPKITVVGVGGAGGNAVNNMINSNLEGVDFLVANTDSQALENSLCERKIQLGLNCTKGLGAGMRPDVGKNAAEEAQKDVESKLVGSNMAFIAAGMGGGTGTGAAPVIAKLARENGVLTVGVVTLPFHFEGMQRMRLADEGIEELKQYVDTLIIIPNQNLFRIANEKTTFSDAFKMADDVLYAGVRGVTDLMVMPGLINLDFSDIKTVMSEMGKAMMGTGEDSGDNRAVGAAEAAMANPLIDDVSLKGAKGLIINITGGKDLTLYEVDEAANRIREEVDVDANIIFGSTCDNRLEGVMRVSIVATGIEGGLATTQKRPAESHAIKINNSVYKKPVPKFVNTHFPSYSKEKDELKPETENTATIAKKDSLAESTTIVENNKSSEEGAPQLQHMHENLESSKDQVESNVKLDSENIFSGEKLDENHVKLETKQGDNYSLLDENSQENEQSNARRISLFDTAKEENEVSEPENIQKKEPYLNYSSQETNEKIDLNNEFNQDNLEEKDHYEDNMPEEEKEEINTQEDELLDIPTFLRRQAN
tara:strand:+ start:236 stop:1888 length:1653 start_codon:yes stop_codon:yes gene_type:complete